MLSRLLARIDRERKSAPDVVLLLKTFEDWCRDAGFETSDDALEALRSDGALRSWRIQSGRIKLVFAAE